MLIKNYQSISQEHEYGDDGQKLLKSTKLYIFLFPKRLKFSLRNESLSYIFQNRGFRFLKFIVVKSYLCENPSFS